MAQLLARAPASLLIIGRVKLKVLPFLGIARYLFCGGIEIYDNPVLVHHGKPHGEIVDDDIVYLQLLHNSVFRLHQIFQVFQVGFSYVNLGAGKDIFRAFAFK